MMETMSVSGAAGMDATLSFNTNIDMTNSSSTDAVAAPPMASTPAAVAPETENTSDSSSAATQLVLPVAGKPPQPDLSSNTGAATTTNHTATTVTAGSNQEPPHHELLSLPFDSLHCIASFLTPSEWCHQFGLCNKTAHAHCREIIRRVRLHGFQCATQVIAAWKVGQWADAQELAALYVSAGVPLYPRCLGHSYHTLRWRMKVEAREHLKDAKVVDPFYGMERLQFRATDNLGRGHSYWEEKCLFYAKKHALLETGKNASTTRGNLGTVHRGRFSPTGVQQPDAESNTSSATSSSTSGNNNSKFKNGTNDEVIPKLIIPVHQHLLDQHRLGESHVDDKDGALATPLISLSADFFNPATQMSLSAQTRKAAREKSVSVVSPPPALDDTLVDINEALRIGGAGPPQPPDVVVAADIIEDVSMAAHPCLATSLKLVDAEGYTASQPTCKCREDVETLELRKHMRSRFATYQRRLEGFLAKRNLTAFEECLLDLWDEFFPHTTGIHYYDMETPVPRISGLHKFLTKPCPKAIGVVQCEIERIKINSRGKGGVKSSVFPKYEYRLFIRDRSSSTASDNNETIEDDARRRDTVLMVAKNRGRKHTELNGPVHTTSSKKGSNNYYLYMPQQRDVDAHYSKTNNGEAAVARLKPNGASQEPVLTSDDASSVLLGRLQSNFFGTEFQIYTPRLRTLPRKSDLPRFAVSEDELDYDSAVSSDNGATRGRSKRFGRLSRRKSRGSQASNTNSGNASSDQMSTGSCSNGSIPERPALIQRTLSAPEIVAPRQVTRTNRRAIANENAINLPAAEVPQSNASTSMMVEEEDGAITYTATILGSRPRIMDVCIPKVTADGVAGAEWKLFLDRHCDENHDHMLNCFRQIQQRLEQAPAQQPQQQDNHLHHQDNQQPQQQQEGDDNESTSTAPDFGLMALQNRPPWWNVELGSFVLNFGGRVSVASVKNFQLCEPTDHDTIILQFGRINGRHSFTMDFQHPLSAVQAFSIAISSLQSKISFG